MLVRLAWRNILRQRRRTILTLLTMTGGFVLSSLSIGWMYGSYGSVIMFFTDNRTGQVQLHSEGYLEDPSIYTTVADYTEKGEVLESISGVRAWAPRIYMGALLAAKSPTDTGTDQGVFSNSAGVSITGIDPELEQHATGFSSRITSGSMLTASPADTSLRALGQILLGKELSIRLEAEVGDSLVLLSQALDGSAADRSYIVTGIVDTGNSQLDRRTGYITLQDAQTLFSMEDRVHEIAVMTETLGEVDHLTGVISSTFAGTGLEVDSWKVFAREFYNGMKADEESLKITISIILLVSAMGVLNTVLMMVLERRREFGVMKAVGTRPGYIVRMILLEAGFMGMLSVVFGSILSTAGLLFLSTHGIVMDPPMEFGGTVFREMIASISPDCYWIPAVAIMVTASLVSLIPALKAAHTEPARTLRTV